MCIKRFLFGGIGVLSFILLFSFSGVAGEKEKSEEPLKLKVGVVLDAPFVIRRPDGSYRGIAIELWERIASLASFQYQLIPYDREDVRKVLEDNTVDIVVGNISINAESEGSIDFTHSFLHTHLVIATVPAGNSSIFDALEQVFSKLVLEWVALVVGGIFFIAFIIWLLERRNNPDIYGNGKFPDFISGTLWVMMLGTALEGDLYRMRHNASRYLGFLLLLAGTTIVASYIALITSNLTVDSLSTVVESPSDLPHVRVIAEENSGGAEYLESRNIKFQTAPHLADALVSLHGLKADAVVGDAMQIKYLLRLDGDDHVTVLPTALRPENLAFGLPPESPHQERIDQALLRAVEEPLWDDILAHYFGRGGL